MDGSRIISRSADLQPGGDYVIVGNEPGGFKYYNYGYYHKLKNPKKLPPMLAFPYLPILTKELL